MVVHLNRRLATCGLLGFTPAAAEWPARARRAALGAVPLEWQGKLLRRFSRVSGALESSVRFAGIDWRTTAAYSEELDYAPSVWIHRTGREPGGVVPDAEYEAVRTRVVDALMSWAYADGRPVVERVHRREEVLHGEATERAPDLFVEFALVDGYSPSSIRSGTPGPAVRRLDASEHGAGRGAGMNGAHRRDGLAIVAGSGIVPAGDLGTLDIVDVVPTLLAAVGLEIPLGLDGVPWTRVLASPPRFAPDRVDPPSGPAASYDEAAEAEIAARLAALGYGEAER
jgi:predicted AlkP superfamily phosphohydrolase/phosphomutase